MVSFKEQLQIDARNVFLNSAEFGETHNIDGKDLVCVVDDHTDVASDAQTGDVIYVQTKRIYACPSDLVKRPVQGKRIDYDRKPYNCVTVAEEGAMLVIKITMDTPA